MGFLRDLLNKLREKKERANAYSEDLHAQKRAQEKEMSSNERELNSYVEEEREKQIKELVDKYRKKKNDEFWYGNQVHKDKRNIFKGQQSILRNGERGKRRRKLFLK